MSFDSEADYFRPTIVGANSDTSIEITVQNYKVNGSIEDFNCHFWSVSVKCDSIKYDVDRSYVDFCDLDRILRKKFPKSDIPLLPLASCSLIQKHLNKDNKLISPDKAKNSNNTARNKFPVYVPEDIIKATGYLNDYFNKLLIHHQIIASEEILRFFDEEATAFAYDSKSIDISTIHEILFKDQISTKITVRAHDQETINYPVKQGYVLLWVFSTIDYDIGFSVELNGEVKIPYTRYKSHEKKINGSLEIIQSGTVLLKFDNTYAKMRSKHLIYSIKLLDNEEYQSMKSLVMEKQRGKKKYEIQRKFLQKTSLLIASSLSGVNHGCSVALEHDEEEINKSKEMHDEINLLNRQLNDAHGDLSRASDELEKLLKEKSDIEIEKNFLQTSFRELQDEHKQSLNHIFNLEMKVEEFRQQNLELVKEKENFELLIVSLQESNTNKDLSIQSLNSNINELNSKFNNDVSVMQNNYEEDKKNMEHSHKLLLDEKINIIGSLDSLINTNREELRVERALNVELKEEIDSLVSTLSKENSTIETMKKDILMLKDNLYIMKGPLQESLDILNNY